MHLLKKNNEFYLLVPSFFVNISFTYHSNILIKLNKLLKLCLINKRILNKLIYSANRKNNRENIKIKEQFVPFFIIFVSICYFVLVGGIDYER